METTLKYIVITLFLMLSLPLFSKDHSEINFRNMQWYDTIDSVKEREKSPFVEYKIQEINVAVNPPVPWKTEHLYFKDTLLGEPVLILYRFDIDCKQLYEGGYIFSKILDDYLVYRLIGAIEDKYKVELNARILDKKIYAGGKLNKDTKVYIQQNGRLHFHTKNTVIWYETNNYSWMSGWKKGAEPMCLEKDKALDRLKNKL
jgi:hypothetical protein